jgi:hypothetical protein
MKIANRFVLNSTKSYEWVKTQFAGIDTHIRVIQILRDIKRFFQTFTVNDEGEYWQSENTTVLAEHIRRCNEVIAELAAESPHSQIKVKEPNGRLIDLIG